LGQELLSRLVQIGRDEKLHRISADILGENTVMQRIAKTLGFTLTRVMGGEYRAELDL
jgi:acetyltransferase